MIKTFVLLLTIVSINHKIAAQQCLTGGCSNFGIQWPTGTLTPSTSWQIASSTMNASNYTVFNVVCGNTYDFTYCESVGGISTSWDARLTLYNSTGGPALCFSGDVCGLGPYIRWTATFSGTVKLLTSLYVSAGSPCQGNSGGPFNRLMYRTFSAPTSTVGITVHTYGGGTRSNAKVKLYNWDYSQLIATQFTNSSGIATFTSVNNGGYNIEVSYTPSGTNPPASNEEFWGAKYFEVCSGGQSIAESFNRNQPYISSAPGFSPTSLDIGLTSTGNFTVTNGLPYSTSSRVEIWVDRSQSSPWDYTSLSSAHALNAGNTSNYTFNVIPANTGEYKFYAFVRSLVDGNYIVTDQYTWTTAFTATCPALPIPTSPTPGSTSGPGPTITTLNPTFSWNGSSAGVYHVQIWNAATNPATNSNVIYGFESPINSPGHCIIGTSHNIPNGVLVNNGQYKWSVHRNEPCGECESSSTLMHYFTVNTNPCIAPTSQASNITFSAVNSDRFTVNWTNGNNGSKRIVKINTSNSFTTPVNSVDPSANAIFQNSGEQVVYNNTGNSFTVTGLSSNTNYWVRVYEANCSGTSILYNTNTNTDNPNNQTTSSGPAPVVDFTTPNPVVVVGQSVTLYDQSSNNPTSWSWLVERQQWNGSYTAVSSSTQPNPTFSFSSAACYRITLTATNAAGSGSLTRPCYIYATPNLNVTIPVDVTRAQRHYTYNAGDPVNLANGSFSFSMKDISLPGIKTTVSLQRKYFSNSPYESIFGLGWHHSFDMNVDFSNAFDWAVQYPDGHNEHYTPYPGGETRTLYPGNFDTLNYTSSAGIPTSFTLIRKDGIRWNFNSEGQIISIVDLDGNQTTFSYSSGRLMTVTLPGGRYLQFTYNAFNKVATVGDNIGRTVYYYYDATGHQLDSTRIANSTTSFRYGASGMTEIYDPRGNRIIQNVYDGQGKVLQQFDAENKLTQFQYNTPAAGQTTVTDPLLKSRVASHDNNARCIQIKNELNAITSYSYSLQGTLDTLTDARGFKTIKQYDTKANEIKTINAKGFSVSTGYTGLNRPDYFRDKQGNIYKTIYSVTGNATQIILPTNDTLRKEYDSHGLDTTITDARGFKTRKLYNNFGDLIQTVTPTGVTSIVYDAVGRPVEITDSYGRKDSLFWNHFDQVVKRKDKMGRVEEYGFDENGNQVSYKDKKGQVTFTQFNKYDNPIRIVQPQNHISEYEYDDNQRKIKSRDPNKNTLIISYDDAGREIAVADSILGLLSQKTYDVAGNILTYKDALNKTWMNRIDEINRITSTINPLGDSIQYKYNGNNLVVEQIDEEGKSTKWEFDAAGRHTKTTDALNNYVQRYLNKNGLTDSVRDARGKTRNKAVYDGSDRLITLNDGYGNYTMVWDSSGNVKTLTDPNNRALTHFYNNNNELVDITNGGNMLRHYLLDDNGDYLQANSNTHNATAIRNQLGWITQYTDNYSNTTEHIYDSVGNVTKVVYPSGKFVDYKYNSLNKCIEAKDWANRVFAINRDNNGNITQIQYANGFKTELIRDDASRVSAWFNKNNLDSVFQSNLILRNRTGNIEKDSGLHVLSFTPFPKVATGTYGNDDRLSIYNNTICTTNVSGQRTSAFAPGRSYSYTWSAINELVTTNHSGVSYSLQYDAFNERTTKASASTNTRYIVDHYLAPFPLILQERDGGNQELINNIYIPGEGIVLARDSAGTFIFYHHDVKGNTIALSNLAGQVIDRYEYNEFGDSIFHAGNSTQPFTWMGMYGVQHDGNGLFYLHARYFDGKTNTFLSKDPNPVNYLNTQDVDRYVYGYNNPLKFIDPTGLVAQNNISYENNNWVKEGLYDALQKIAEGRWVATGFAKDAVDYYEQEYINSVVRGHPNNLYLVGLGFSSLWTPENYQQTLSVLTLKSNFSGKGATKILGKTGFLKLIDMRTVLGRSIKEIAGVYDAYELVDAYKKLSEKLETFIQSGF